MVWSWVANGFAVPEAGVNVVSVRAMAADSAGSPSTLA